MVRYRTVVKRRGGKVISVKTYTQSKSGKWTQAKATASPAGASAQREMRRGGGGSGAPAQEPTPAPPTVRITAKDTGRVTYATLPETSREVVEASMAQARRTTARRQVATQTLVTRTAPREPEKPKAIVTKAEPMARPSMVSAWPGDLTKAQLAERQRITYGTGAKGFLARKAKKYRTDYPFDPKAPVSFAVGVGKFGYGVAMFGKSLATSPVKTVKETGKGLFSLVKDPTKAGYQFAEYARKAPFEAAGQVGGAVLFSKGVEKVTAKVGTKVTQKYGKVELKPSKVVTKTRVVKTPKGTELRGTAMLKGKAETYIPIKIKGKAKIVSRPTPKVYAMKRPGGTFSEAFGEPGKVKVFGQKTAKAFRRESDVAMKFKIKGTPKEFVGKGKGVVDATRIKVKSAAPAYVRGARTAEIYDIQTGKQFGKLLRGAKTKTQDITRITTVGKKQTIVRGQRVTRTDSVFKIRPTGKKEVVIAPKEMIYAREAKKAGRFGIGEAKIYETFTVKTPPIRTTRFKGAELIAPIKGKEAFAKGFGRVSAETIVRKTKLEKLARAQLRGYLPKEARIVGVTGVGLETPTTVIVPPRTRPSARYLSGIGATAKDIAKGAVLLKPRAGIAGLGVIPALRQVPKTQPAFRPIQRPRVIQRIKQRPKEKPSVREITIPRADTEIKLSRAQVPRQIQRVGQRIEPIQVQEPRTDFKIPRTPRVALLDVPPPGIKIAPFKPLRREKLRVPGRRFRTLLKQPKAYAPTLRARIFKIKAPKGIEKKRLTGLEERGLLI